MADAQKAYVFKDSSRLTRVTIWAIYALCVTEGLSLIVNLVGATSAQEADAQKGFVAVQALLLVIDFLALVVSGIITLVWIHRANTNAHALTTQAMEFTPGWAVGWNFVPFASLWKPFQVVREIWDVSKSPSVDGDGAPAIMRLWWGLWIANNIFAQISGRLAGEGVATVASDVTGLIGNAANIASCIFLVMMMRRIAGWQNHTAHAEAVFA